MQPRLPSFQEFTRRSLHSSILPFHLPPIIVPFHRDVLYGGIARNKNGTVFVSKPRDMEVLPTPLPSFIKTEEKRPVQWKRPASQSITAVRYRIEPAATSSAFSSSNNAKQRAVPLGHPMAGAPCLSLHCKNKGVTNGLCKTHGGGKRCTYFGCKKSSQSMGLCRKHGGGKLCTFEGCTSGTQRGGRCHLVSSLNMY